MDAGDIPGPVAGADGRAHGFRIIRHRGNGDRIVALVVECIDLGPASGRSLHRAALPREGGDMERRASIAIAHISIDAVGDHLPDRVDGTNGRGDMQAGIAGHLSRTRRNLCRGNLRPEGLEPTHRACQDEKAAQQP